MNMKEVDGYIKARNEAMLAYPDTTKLDGLLITFKDYYPKEFRLMWAMANPQTKLRTMESMILDWTEAPLSLVAKVKEAEFIRLRKGKA